MEEKYFYPKVKELLEASNPKIVEDSLAEHHAAKLILLELQVLNIKSPKFDSLIQVLEDSVMHHVETEEATLLPFANDVMSKKAAEELGKEMREYKEGAQKGILEKLFA